MSNLCYDETSKITALNNFIKENELKSNQEQCCDNVLSECVSVSDKILETTRILSTTVLNNDIGEKSNDTTTYILNPDVVVSVNSTPVRQVSSWKRKHRSRVLRKKTICCKKRKWRPLWKLTKKEREKVYKRESRRVERDREALRAAGVALAPHNTSDFLIKDRGISSPDEDEIFQRVQLSTQEGEYNQDFEEIYQSMHVDLYDKLAKFQLVDLWIETEDQIEAIEKQLNAVKERKELLGLSGFDVASEMAKIEVFKEEISKLIVENDELLTKNETLRSYLSK